MLTHDLVESARQEGGDFYLVRRLHEMTDIAQRSGLERDDVANAWPTQLDCAGLIRPRARYSRRCSSSRLANLTAMQSIRRWRERNGDVPGEGTKILSPWG